jgi:hypothetical protein
MNAMTPQSDQKLLAALRNSPEAVKLVAAENERIIAERQKPIDAIKALDAKARREFPALEKGVQTAIAGVREAEKALHAANDKLRMASHAKSAASNTYTRERHLLETQLRDGVSAKLFDDFQSEMFDEIEESRKQFEGGYVRVRNRVTGRLEERGYNNSISVNGRIAAIKTAMDEAEALRLAADQSVAAARLAELRATLPKIVPAIRPGEEKE